MPEKIEPLFIGRPLVNREAICKTLEEIRDEVSDVGRKLAAQHGFDYPEALEKTVRQCWDDFREKLKASD